MTMGEQMPVLMCLITLYIIDTFDKTKNSFKPHLYRNRETSRKKVTSTKTSQRQTTNKDQKTVALLCAYYNVFG